MKKAVLLLMAFLFLLPYVAVANPIAQRAAATLTNNVMKSLEPQIAEMVEKSSVPPAMREEFKRQLTEAARRIVDSEIQGAMGGSLPNPVAVVNKVLGELGTIAQNMMRGGSFAGAQVAQAEYSDAPIAAPPPPHLQQYNQPPQQQFYQPQVLPQQQQQVGIVQSVVPIQGNASG